jgi:hypothetical protein
MAPPVEWRAAEELLETVAAGYLDDRLACPQVRSDVAQAVSLLGPKAGKILKCDSREYDAMHRKVAGCYGTSPHR